jgi:hypothetical protein
MSNSEVGVIDPLRALIARWRAQAALTATFHATMGTGWHVCADELEAALSVSPPPTPPALDIRALTAPTVDAILTLLKMDGFISQHDWRNEFTDALTSFGEMLMARASASRTPPQETPAPRRKVAKRLKKGAQNG